MGVRGQGLGVGMELFEVGGRVDVLDVRGWVGVLGVKI